MKPIIYLDEDGNIKRLKEGEVWKKPDYEVGTYCKGKFTPYGTNEKIDAKPIIKVESEKIIHGSFKEGVFKPFGWKNLTNI